MCQGAKQPTKIYGKLNTKLSEETPWNKLCVDIIGTYKYIEKGKRL